MGVPVHRAVETPAGPQEKPFDLKAGGADEAGQSGSRKGDMAPRGDHRERNLSSWNSRVYKRDPTSLSI